MSDATDDVAAERSRRWWQHRRPVHSLDRAAAFIEDVGFALLFAPVDRSMPSLFDAASDRPGKGLGDGWGPEAERIWSWKDELPKRGLAWYGRFVRGRPSFLAPAMLRDLYPRSGRPDDFAGAGLGEDATKIAEILLLNGPTSTAVLREATDAFGPKARSRFDRAISELGRALIITHAGVEEQGSGWPSAVLELTARVFELGDADRAEPEFARSRSTERFLDTMVVARPYELGNAFGCGAVEARRRLEALVSAGVARRDGSGYRLSQQPAFNR